MPLSDTRARSLKPADKKYRTADTDGLYIEVSPNGKKRWVFRYTDDHGKRHWKTLGEFPMVGLREAREIRDRNRRKLFDGVPLEKEEPEAVPTFRTAALEWYKKNSRRWTEEYARINLRRLEMHVFPSIGDDRIADIKTKDILRIVHRIEESKTIDTSRRVVQLCSRVFRHSVICEYCESDPTYALRGALPPLEPKHLASLTDPKDVALLLRNIDAYPQPITRAAMQFSALTFLRPGEVRHAEWTEIDREKAEMRISAEKMKMRRPHIVPLARQALDVLEKIRVITGHGRYVFPNARALQKGDRPMSENAVLVALRAMGYTKDQMTAHGFRSMASTLLNENGFNRDWIERQLAHVEGNAVRAAYNYAEYLPERRRMMQWWADCLEGLKIRP